MPIKLKLLVALLLVSIVTNVITLNLIGLIVMSAVLFGLFRGNEGLRTTLIYVSVAMIFISGFLFVSTYLIVPPPKYSNQRLSFVITIIQSSFTVWCLRQLDVRNWMSRKAFGE